MKKIIMFPLIVICAFILTGCGNTKTLKCTIESTSSYDKIDNTGYEISFDFSKDGTTLKKFTEVSYSIYSSKTSASELNSAYDDIDELCKDYKNYSGINCKRQKNGNKISAILTIDLSKANDESTEKVYLDSFIDNTYDEIKAAVQEMGYACK